MSSTDELDEQYVLYKIFIRKISRSTAPLHEGKLTEMFGALAEPFKVFVGEDNKWALAFFVTHQDAKACIAAFSMQPPYFYEIVPARDEVHQMSPNEIQKMKEKLAWQAKKLRQIEMQMQELKMERSRIKSRMSGGGGYNFDESESGMSEDFDMENGYNNNLKSTRSSISGSRTSLYDGRSRSKTRSSNNFQPRQSNNFNNTERSRKPFRQEGRRDCEETFRESIPDREYNNIHQNRTPRQSGTFNGNSFKDRQQRSQTPVGNWRNTRGDEEPVGILKTNPEQSESRRESNFNERKFESFGAEPKIERAPRRESANPEPVMKYEREPAVPEPKLEAPKVERVPLAVTKPVLELNIKRQSIVELLKPTHTGLLKIKIVDGNNFIGVCEIAHDFLDHVDKIKNMWENYSEDNSITPNVGEFVCVENDDTWSRGYVVEKLASGYKVALVDEAKYVHSANPCKVLQEHESIPEFACQGKVDGLSNMVNKTFGFVIKSVGQNTLVTLKDRKTKQDICDVTLSRWIPKELSIPQQVTQTPLNRIIPSVQIPSGSLVMLAFFQNQRNVFLKHRESGSLLLKINAEMLENGPKLPPLTQPINEGDCLAAKFSEDGNWYRAVVTELSSDKQSASVVYVDYGNSEKIAIKDGKELSKTMLETPRALLNVDLKGVQGLPLTVELAKYFTECSDKKIKYKMNYDQIENGVTLVTSAGSLNEEILQFLQSKKQVPTPKTEEKLSPKPIEPPRLIETPKLVATKPIESPKPVAAKPIEPPKPIESIPKDDDVEIKVVDLPLGKTELIFQKVMDADDKLILCYKNDLELLTQVQIELTEEIGEYVISAKKEEFEPEQGSPCLALFEGAWYRALCLSATAKEATVLFVDFGNYETIEMKDIRKLPSHFAMVPAVALICTVVDVPANMSAEKFSSLFSELAPYEAEVIEKEDEGQYKIRMPHINN